MEGTVVEVLPNTIFLVKVKDDHYVRAYLSGRMRKHRIRILAGDKVTIEVSIYDLEQGRITYRHK